MKSFGLDVTLSSFYINVEKLQIEFAIDVISSRTNQKLKTENFVIPIVIEEIKVEKLKEYISDE